MIRLDFPKLALSVPLLHRRSEIWSELCAALDRRSGGYAIALNPEKIMKAAEDPGLLETIHRSAIPYADGIGIVLAGRRFGLPRIERYPGIDLFTDALAWLDQKKGGLFLFGAKPDVLGKAILEIRRRHPGIRLVGSCPGYGFDEGSLRTEIQRANPELVAVALGSPAQERWIRSNAPHLPGIFFMGVGGSFDVLSGSVKRAPKIFRLFGLEWLHRLLSQPTRMKRQLCLIRFAWILF